MDKRISRRRLMAGAPGLSVAAAMLSGIPLAAAAAEPPAGSARGPLWPGFPRQDLQYVRAAVIAGHGQEAKLRELVEARPALVNAWWDWGFGDWESPLGGAAHTGQRSIALYLIERGARIDIFAAAMLGMTDVVKGFVSAQPGVQRTPGPHGIPLLAHAQVGGEHAKPTLAYLETLGDAGLTPKLAALPDERKPAYAGEYAIEGAPEQRLTVRLARNGQFQIELKNPAGEALTRGIYPAAMDEFCPVGVPSVRLRFDVRNGKAQTLTLVEREPVVVARRVGD
jgi:hypothetical protein